MKKPLRWVLRIFPAMMLLMLVVAASFVLIGRIERTVEADGQVRVHGYQIVRTPVTGQVAEIFASTGQRVRSGQPLVRLIDPEREGQLAEAEQHLAAVRTALDRLNAERRLRDELIDPLELSRRLEQRRQRQWGAELATSRRRESELALDALQQRLEQTLELQRHGLVSQQGVEEARREVKAAEERLVQRRIEEHQAVASETSFDIEMRLLGGEQRRSSIDMLAELRRLEGEQALWAGEVERLHESAALYMVAADIDGVLVSEPSNELIGRQVTPGDELVRVVDLESIRFVSYIAEESVIRVRAGQLAAVELVGLPKQRFHSFEGQVQRIDQRPELDASGVPVYAVEIDLAEPWVLLDEGAFYLRGGMRGTARIAYQHGMPLSDALYEFLVGAPALPRGSPDEPRDEDRQHGDRTVISQNPPSENARTRSGQF